MTTTPQTMITTRMTTKYVTVFFVSPLSNSFSLSIATLSIKWKCKLRTIDVASCIYHSVCPSAQRKICSLASFPPATPKIRVILLQLKNNPTIPLNCMYSSYSVKCVHFFNNDSIRCYTNYSLHPFAIHFGFTHEEAFSKCLIYICNVTGSNWPHLLYILGCF